MISDPESSENRHLFVADVSEDFVNYALENGLEWQAIFQVRVESDPDAQLPPVAGNYDLAGTVLKFRPLFPLSEGLNYKVIFRYRSENSRLITKTAKFTIPKQVKEPTTLVTQIYPSSDELPENLLKFYVHFSAPVRKGRSYSYVELLDESGEPLELPFLELNQELWNPDGTRLTLLLDPGRIKQGLVPNEEVGQILEAGKTYTLAIDQNWPDMDGNSLVSEVRKTFTATEADHESPSPDAWVVSLPQPGTRDELIVKFPDPMDEAILQRGLWIENPQGETVPGSAVVSNEETVWTFFPTVGWELGVYQLTGLNTLEDRSGNNIGSPFEVMQGERSQDVPEVFKRALIIGN